MIDVAKPMLVEQAASSSMIGDTRLHELDAVGDVLLEPPERSSRATMRTFPVAASAQGDMRPINPAAPVTAPRKAVCIWCHASECTASRSSNNMMLTDAAWWTGTGKSAGHRASLRIGWTMCVEDAQLAGGDSHGERSPPPLPPIPVCSRSPQEDNPARSAATATARYSGP